MNQNYQIRELSETEFSPLLDQHKEVVFKEACSYGLNAVLSAAEQERTRELSQAMGKPYRLHLGAFNSEGRFIGWSWGHQENASTFYMVNSAVLKDHRRKGVYKALIGQTIDTLSKKGFQLIYSRHCATNNAVIIPKLKAGFIISKMEIDDRFGVLIHLHYYTNEDRRRIMDYRAGQRKPDARIKSLFGL